MTTDGEGCYTDTAIGSSHISNDFSVIQLTSRPKIPFNQPYLCGKELWNIAQAHANGQLAGDGLFTKKCQEWLEGQTGSPKVLLTHSCTAALELAALLLGIKAGDEIIMPSFTFVSTANAFVLRGAVPVFVDIREDTLNLDETKIEAAITEKTKAIVPVHYAGVACEMKTVKAIAARHGLRVIEDAAQGLMASYKGQPLGSIGDLGAFSFHETKNLISGEGGAVLINDPELISRAEIIREKGTDRTRFFRGEVDKYTWQEVGSSFLPGELIAAFLWGQLGEATQITAARLHHWRRYDELLEPLEMRGLIRRPVIPRECTHNAHMYYVTLCDGIDRQEVLREMARLNVNAIFHYIPLHQSPAGRRYGRVHGSLGMTERQSERLIRLPLWVDLDDAAIRQVVDVLTSTVTALSGRHEP